MADRAAQATVAPSDTKPSVAVNRDRVGEELADDAHIWHVYDRVAREDDERRTKAWDTGLNNLALFAGLFSAVTTAFIIEAQQDLEPDYAQLTFLVLNASASGEKFVQQPFAVPQSARTVNCLWVSSLILSLSAALIAIMGKDWIGMYTARPVCNLRQWAEMRAYRLNCVEKWYMSGVIAAAPVLLHLSLLLFGAGLVLFIASDPVTHHLTLGLSLAAGALYLVTTLSAVAFSASPFKSPATQMIRAAVSALYSYFCSIIYRPKRNPLRTLVCEIHAMVLRRVDGTAFLPGSPAGNRHPYARLCNAIANAPGNAIARVRKIPTGLRTVRNNLHMSPVQSSLHSISLAARQISFDWFLSSMWTDLPTDRRPKLLAEALSWLSGASQAPDDFRAVIFALGDLDVGPQVGEYTSLALRARLRAEIRRTWKHVDFLMLARYVLADRNSLGDPVLDHIQFEARFDLSKESSLRCEDGLAALIKISPGFIAPDWLVQYLPDQVEQPRMLEFLQPYMQKTQDFHIDILILLSNRYRKHLWTMDYFNLGNLEAHLYKTLNTKTRDEYATAVTVKYGGTSGAIELLTFLCCQGVIDDNTIPAAVELVMELLKLSHGPIPGNRCLAYLFGSGELWDATWKDKHWSDWYIRWISASLTTSCRHPFEPSSVRTVSDDRQFDIALARTVVMLLSPHNNIYGQQLAGIRFLFGHLCQSPSPSLPDNNERPDVIRLVLENAALLGIMHPRPLHGIFPAIDVLSTRILAAIIRDLGRRLCNPKTIHDGARLFNALARTEVNGPHGEPRVWDLGEWLRTRALEVLTCSSSSTAMDDVHDALCALYPLCEQNIELRVHWDRIGYPGRPGDIFSSPFLDIGEFFAIIEDPLSRIQMYGWPDYWEDS